MLSKANNDKMHRNNFLSLEILFGRVFVALILCSGKQTLLMTHDVLYICIATISKLIQMNQINQNIISFYSIKEKTKNNIKHEFQKMYVSV